MSIYKRRISKGRLTSRSESRDRAMQEILQGEAPITTTTTTTDSNTTTITIGNLSTGLVITNAKVDNTVLNNWTQLSNGQSVICTTELLGSRMLTIEYTYGGGSDNLAIGGIINGISYPESYFYCQSLNLASLVIPIIIGNHDEINIFSTFFPC